MSQQIYQEEEADTKPAQPKSEVLGVIGGAAVIRTQTERKQRGRKRRLGVEDVDSQRYQCFCAKQYLSYCALYSHVKFKHPQFFSGNHSFASSNMVDTFDPNYGYKIRKLLRQPIVFYSDELKKGPTIQGTKVKAESLLSNALQENKDEARGQSDQIASNNLGTVQSAGIKISQVSERAALDKSKIPYAASSALEVDIAKNRPGILQGRSPANVGPGHNYIQNLASNQYVMDKFQEGKYFQLHQIERLGKRLDQSKELSRMLGRKLVIASQKQLKMQDIIDRMKSAVESYQSILRIINVGEVTQWLDNAMIDENSSSQSSEQCNDDQQF